jgi:hypothetical protein
MISARHDGLAGSGGVRSLLLCVRKMHPEEVLESHSSGGGAPRVKAVAHVDVGAGGIDGRFTQKVKLAHRMVQPSPPVIWRIRL